MTLINEIMRSPIDPGYAAAAARKKAQQEGGRSPGVRPTTRLVVLTVTVLLGLLVGTAIVNLRLPAAASAQAREELVQRVDAANAAVAQRGEQVATLQSQIAALQRSGDPDNGQAATRAATLGLLVGTVAMAGPAVQITLDDAPESALPAGPNEAERGGQFNPGRVVASDVQAVANALWGAGAEAIAINGHRLTSTSAIRFAGQAILVNYRPLTRPYVITALGAPDLGSRFSAGEGGAYLEQLASAYGARTDVRTLPQGAVPAGTALTLRYARPEASQTPATTTPTETSPNQTSTTPQEAPS
ncbi:uncharacterized protein YlxW (UPF0749 family) [Kineosphaera limosa]|uniref:DUF881 domain-containing protein n=2 Tax=Kineosphaera TaxID=211469 RepID=K6VIX9_9MICO|nr:DUF881 domain-containing protein [Kineosphaera limosa]NYD98824.1 uncharacterized protein YlxW (UPF0749 family) [Kineosphaera limosa]GAB96188.1 hypothetical protein KILIM_033_00080 [Kineosphaera limosa NBRC 100340]